MISSRAKLLGSFLPGSGSRQRLPIRQRGGDEELTFVVDLEEGHRGMRWSLDATSDAHRYDDDPPPLP